MEGGRINERRGKLNKLSNPRGRVQVVCKCVILWAQTNSSRRLGPLQEEGSAVMECSCERGQTKKKTTFSSFLILLEAKALC